MSQKVSREEGDARIPLLVSACLAGIPCRYDGRANTVAEIAMWHARGLVLPVCPEVLGGLPTPRIPCELRSNSVFDKNGTDRTEAFLKGAQKALALAQEAGVRTAILKARSPSCGKGCVYDGTFSHTLCKGDGVFAGLLLKHGIAVCTEETFRELEPEKLFCRPIAEEKG